MTTVSLPSRRFCTSKLPSSSERAVCDPTFTVTRGSGVPSMAFTVSPRNPKPVEESTAAGALGVLPAQPERMTDTSRSEGLTVSMRAALQSPCCRQMPEWTEDRRQALVRDYGLRRSIRSVKSLWLGDFGFLALV